MAETTTGPFLTGSSHTRSNTRTGKLAAAAFSLWLLLSLTTSSWRYGPFSWWPLWHFPRLAGGPLALGVLNLLPLLAAAGWLFRRLLARDFRWSWGHPALTLPFLALTLLGLSTLASLTGRLTFISAGGLLLTWLVYLALLNERPLLLPALAAIVLVQSAVGLGQFLLQHDLGLVLWGELPLHPGWEGASVLSARGQPWLRAYGLLAHPNLLGALLALLLLFLLPTIRQASQRRQWPALLLGIGLLGLLVSFSRAAWLGAATGLLLSFWLQARAGGDQPRGPRTRRWLWLLLPLLLFFAFYHDLALRRVLALDSPLEAQSIGERLRDAQLALELIAHSPWTGVGLGGYLDAARLLDPAAVRVHNAILLVTAELGLPGLSCWLLLAAAPFWLAWRGRLDPAGLPAWLAMLVVNIFDTTLWWGGNWQTAILFGLLLAHLHRPQVAPPGAERAAVE